MPTATSVDIVTLILDLERRFKVKTKRRFGYVPTTGGHARGLTRTWAELEAQLPGHYWATLMLVNKSDYAAARTILAARGGYTEIQTPTLSQYPSLLFESPNG